MQRFKRNRLRLVLVAVAAALAFAVGLGINGGGARARVVAQEGPFNVFFNPNEAVGTGDHSVFEFPIPLGIAGMSVSGATSGVFATERIFPMPFSGSGTVTEATSLYIDGPPTLSGISGSLWSVHVASGTTFLEGQLEVAPAGGYLFVVNPSVGMYWQAGDGGAGAGLTALNATAGFIYIPTTGGGTPTGTPANVGSRAGATAMVYDQTGDHLYVWNPSTHLWKVH